MTNVLYFSDSYHGEKVGDDPFPWHQDDTWSEFVSPHVQITPGWRGGRGVRGPPLSPPTCLPLTGSRSRALRLAFVGPPPGGGCRNSRGMASRRQSAVRCSSPAEKFAPNDLQMVQAFLARAGVDRRRFRPARDPAAFVWTRASPERLPAPPERCPSHLFPFRPQGCWLKCQWRFCSSGPAGLVGRVLYFISARTQRSKLISTYYQM